MALFICDIDGQTEEFFREVVSQLTAWSKKYGVTLGCEVYFRGDTPDSLYAKLGRVLVPPGVEKPEVLGQMRVMEFMAGCLSGKALFPELKSPDGFSGFEVSCFGVKTMGDWSTTVSSTPLYNDHSW
jgi:hypothetical protein